MKRDAMPGSAPAPRGTLLNSIGPAFLAVTVLACLGSAFRAERLEVLHGMEGQVMADRTMHAELAARSGPAEASARWEVVRWNDELLHRVQGAERRVLPPRGLILPEPVSRETRDLLRLR